MIGDASRKAASKSSQVPLPISKIAASSIKNYGYSSQLGARGAPADAHALLAEEQIEGCLGVQQTEA